MCQGLVITFLLFSKQAFLFRIHSRQTNADGPRLGKRGGRSGRRWRVSDARRREGIPGSQRRPVAAREAGASVALAMSVVMSASPHAHGDARYQSRLPERRSPTAVQAHRATCSPHKQRDVAIRSPLAGQTETPACHKPKARVYKTRF